MEHISWPWFLLMLVPGLLYLGAWLLFVRPRDYRRRAGVSEADLARLYLTAWYEAQPLPPEPKEYKQAA